MFLQDNNVVAVFETAAHQTYTEVIKKVDSVEQYETFYRYYFPSGQRQIEVSTSNNRVLSATLLASFNRAREIWLHVLVDGLEPTEMIIR